MISAAAVADAQNWVTGDCTGRKASDCWFPPIREPATPFQLYPRTESDPTADVGYGTVRIFGVRGSEFASQPFAINAINAQPSERLEIFSGRTVVIGNLLPSGVVTTVNLVAGGSGEGLVNLLRYEPHAVPGVAIFNPSVSPLLMSYGWAGILGAVSSIGAGSDAEFVTDRPPTDFWAAPALLQSAAAEAVVEPHPARLAVADLREWLDITYAELGEVTNIGETTFLYWNRENAAPRPATTRQLYRVHAFVGSVRRVLGPDVAAQWFRAGTPSPLDLLREGKFSEIERLASRTIFAGQEGLTDYSRQYSEDADASYVAEVKRPLKLHPLKRVRRTRLGQ